MKRLFVSRIGAVWLILVLATLLSWMLGHGLGAVPLQFAAIGVIAIAFVKVRFVIFEFMELRGAPMAMRMAADAWLLVAVVVLCGLYMTGS